MGQEEIIEFLRNKRVAGDDSFYSVREIARGLNGGSHHYAAVRRSLYSLVRLGVVESKAEGDLFEWTRVFRISDKYVEVV